MLGQKQPASCGAWIYIDAFEVVTSSATRIEENDPRVTRGLDQYSWGGGSDSRASGGALITSATAGVTLNLPFSGTGISVIGIQDSCSGQAQVNIDGIVQTFDAFRGDGTGGWQRTLYTVAGLPAGSHELTLTVLGTNQPASCAAWIYIDAFDIF